MNLTSNEEKVFSVPFQILFAVPHKQQNLEFHF